MLTQNLQPVTKTDEGIFNTTSGRKVNLNDPISSMIDTLDIAQALSKICRFGGHTPAFYSVAQHTLLVEHLAPEHLKKAAMLHDFSEAFVGDVIKPLKHLLGKTYADIENRFQVAIYKSYNVNIALLDDIKPYDTEALVIEHGYFRNLGDMRLKEIMYQLDTVPLMDNSIFWHPYKAELLLLQRFNQLFYGAKTH